MKEKKMSIEDFEAEHRRAKLNGSILLPSFLFPHPLPPHSLSLTRHLRLLHFLPLFPSHCLSHLLLSKYYIQQRRICVKVKRGCSKNKGIGRKKVRRKENKGKWIMSSSSILSSRSFSFSTRMSLSQVWFTFILHLFSLLSLLNA